MLLPLDVVFAHDRFLAVQPGNLLVSAGGLVKLADYAVLVGLKVRAGVAKQGDMDQPLCVCAGKGGGSLGYG